MVEVEKWRDVDKNNVMLGFVLDKKEELTDEKLEQFKEKFRKKFGLEPTKVEIGRPERHIWVGRWN